jgi:hypothetical protein
MLGIAVSCGRLLEETRRKVTEKERHGERRIQRPKRFYSYSA